MVVPFAESPRGPGRWSWALKPKLSETFVRAARLRGKSWGRKLLRHLCVVSQTSDQSTILMTYRSVRLRGIPDLTDVLDQRDRDYCIAVI